MTNHSKLGRRVRIVGLTLLLFAGCGTVPPRPGRVVSLVPSVTEIIYALGQEQQLAGNTTFCDYPPSARMLYKVGDFSNPSVEKIAGLKPRLVFATLPEQRLTVERLRQMGLRVFVSRPGNIDSLLQEVLTIGRELGAAARAESLARAMRRRLEQVPRAARPVRVYVEISDQPLMTIGKATFINDALTRAGGVNVFGDVDKEYPVVSQELIIDRDPEVILVLHPATTARSLAERLGWQNVAAVRTGRVCDELDPDLLFRSGPRIVDGIEQMARLFSRITP